MPLDVHAAAGMKTPSSFRAASPHAAAHFGFGSKMKTRILRRANACSRPKEGLRQLLPPSARCTVDVRSARCTARCASATVRADAANASASLSPAGIAAFRNFARL